MKCCRMWPVDGAHVKNTQQTHTLMQTSKPQVDKLQITKCQILLWGFDVVGVIYPSINIYPRYLEVSELYFQNTWRQHIRSLSTWKGSTWCYNIDYHWARNWLRGWLSDREYLEKYCRLQSNSWLCESLGRKDRELNHVSNAGNCELFTPLCHTFLLSPPTPDPTSLQPVDHTHTHINLQIHPHMCVKIPEKPL